MEQVMTERDLLLAYVDARKEFESLDESFKQAREKLDQAEGKLVEALTANNATSTAKYEGLGFVALSKPVLYVSYDKEKEDQVFEFIRKNKMDSIIKPTVHNRSLSSFVGMLIESGVEIPEMFKQYFRQGVRYYSS